MNNYNIETDTIGEIVAMDFRTASVFKGAGIDFCCGGKQTVSEACIEKGIDSEKIMSGIKNLTLTPNTTTHNFKEWEVGFLCDYIMNTHHKYVLNSLPELVQYTQKIADVHGDRHPELIEVAALFIMINKELLTHLRKEEDVLFPAIKMSVSNITPQVRELILSEITRMKGEHEFAGDAMDKIKELTNNYFIPADSCTTYKVALKMLEEFEDDLHTHVHIENNILYPKAIKIR